MEFSWNKWRQYIIQEAAVNEETDREIIDAAVDILGKKGRETHYLHRKFKEEGSDDIDGVDVSNARAIIRKGGEIMEDDQAVFNRGPVDFGNDDESRFQYVAYRLSGYENHPQYKELQGHVRTMADAMDVEEGSLEFTQAFIKAMQIMGKEDMLREEENLEEDKFDNPGWDLKAIMDSFKEDFEEASNSTDDIVYAQERVIAAYKDVFAKSHPKLSREIDMYLNNKDAETRKMFQNVDGDPEVVGRDMMSEAPIVVDDFEKGDRVALNVAYQKANGNERMIPSEFKFTVVGVREVPKGGGGTYQDVSVERYENGKPIRKSYDNSQLARIEDQEWFGEIEGEVQTEIDAFDEALNDMAIEKAMTATKLDALQNDLEATLSQEEIDTLSDAIVLLRKK